MCRPQLIKGVPGLSNGKPLGAASAEVVLALPTVGNWAFTLTNMLCCLQGPLL